MQPIDISHRWVTADEMRNLAYVIRYDVLQQYFFFWYFTK